jgi:hypothetical protein
MQSYKLVIQTLALSAVVVSLCVSCGDSNVETVQRGQQSGTPSAQTAAKAPSTSSAAGTTASAAGVTWTIPEGWDVMGPKPMRAATYMIGEGDNTAECAVFFFGTGQGGDVQSNLTRWIGQFQQPDGSDSKAKAKTVSRTINGLKVMTIDLTGTYAAGGMMGQPSTPKPGYRLLGAIVEAPQGPLFFKLTGPEAAVAEIQPHFDNLVAMLKTS